MSTLSAQAPIISSGLTVTDASQTDGELEGPTPPVSFVSCLTLLNLMDRELRWSKSINSILGGSTVEATARIIDAENVKCIITVKGKRSGENAYFDFGTANCSPYAACRSDAAVESIMVPLHTNYPAHTTAMIALSNAIREPASKLKNSLVQGWPKAKLAPIPSCGK
jgi:hypothetical protein